MIRGYEDLAVGLVAIATGVFLVGAAAVNWQWFYSLSSARFLQRWLGRPGARCVHVAVGLGLIALGCAIAQGFRLPLFGN